MTKNEVTVIEQDETLPTQPTAPLIQMIERVAMNPEMDVTKLEKMLDMQERVLDREAKQAFHQDFVSAQAEMPEIEAADENKQTNSLYAKLERIIPLIVPVYTKHGFTMSFNTPDCPIQDHIRIVAIVRHRLGHSETFQRDLPIDNAGIAGKVNKTKLHANASTVTYGERYLTGMIWNLAVGTLDTDGNMPDDCVSETQVSVLKKLLIQCEEGTEEKLLRHYKIESLEELPASWFEDCQEILNKKVGA